MWTEWCRHWPADELVVVTPRVDGDAQYDEGQPFRIKRLWYPDIPKIRVLWTSLGLMFSGLVQTIQNRPQVVHFAQLLETGFWAPLLRRCFGVPYFVHVYGEELAYCLRRPQLRWLARRILSSAQGVTVISHFTLNLLRRDLGFSGDALLVHPGVDTERFAPGDGGDIRTRLNLGSGPLLLTVGRLMRRKGHDMVITALPDILKKFPDLTYAIAGTGPEEDLLRRLVAERGLESSVCFLGRVDEPDLIRLYQTADLFVHPNRELASGDVEGFGIVFLEASACGTAVLGGRSGGTADAIREGVNGYVLDGASGEEIRDAVVELLEKPELRRALALSARRFAQDFEWHVAARRVYEWSMKESGYQ